MKGKTERPASRYNLSHYLPHLCGLLGLDVTTVTHHDWEMQMLRVCRIGGDDEPERAAVLGYLDQIGVPAAELFDAVNRYASTRESGQDISLTRIIELDVEAWREEPIH
jgi:hypothetical protein